MRNIKLTIEYDGSRYHGWQSQPNVITIQEEIEKALKKITKEDITIFGSGRTDKGVHALGQVANFITNSKIEASKFMLALNSLLPKDIVIINSEEVQKEFHSRFSAIRKQYEYRIYNSKIRSPINRNFSYHVYYNLDLEKIIEASKYFEITSDFSAFMASNSTVKDTIRTIYKLTIRKENNFLIVNITGNGFLYNMVRIIVGTLIDTGRGKIAVEDIPKIIKTADRKKAGHTAPPQGLYLKEVYY